MAKRISAYVTDDGRIYVRKFEAVEHDTRRELSKFLISDAIGCNEALAKKITDHAPELALLLKDLLKEVEREIKEREG